MLENFYPNRYSIIENKNKREIVMLRGRGCRWRRCRFCDYHQDSNPNDALNFRLNRQALANVTGLYQKLEVINSGSFSELDEDTMSALESLCKEKNISQLHFEAHWSYRDAIPALKKRFARQLVEVKVKIGVETFDTLYRESFLDKGISTDTPSEIARYFDECCLLLGLPGQTVASMERDIRIGLMHFQRVCINIMQENSTPIKPDPAVISAFTRELYPQYIDNERVDILMENTDFGVGGVLTDAQ